MMLPLGSSIMAEFLMLVGAVTVLCGVIWVVHKATMLFRALEARWPAFGVVNAALILLVIVGIFAFVGWGQWSIIPLWFAATMGLPLAVMVIGWGAYSLLSLLTKRNRGW